MTDPHQPAEGFFYQPNTIRWILRIFYGLSVLLLLADLLVHRHIETSAEKIPGFYAFYGFIACVVLVIIASKMREWLMRDEDYYKEDDVQTVPPSSATVKKVDDND